MDTSAAWRNGSTYWQQQQPEQTWEEPDYEPVSPSVPRSNPINYDWPPFGSSMDNSGGAKARAHVLPLPSEPPQKRMRNTASDDPPAAHQAVKHLFPGGSMETSANLPYGALSTPAELPPGGHMGRPRPTGKFLQKTKLCTRFETGTCTFNANCNFAHGLEELRKPPFGFEGGSRGSNPGSGPSPRFHKTRPCKFFLEGNCPYRDRCNFLHDGEQRQQSIGGGVNEGRGVTPVRGPSARPLSWKTKLCMKWENSQHCDFGDKCHFAHGVAELQKYGGGVLHAESGVGLQGDIKPSNNFTVPYLDPTRPGSMCISALYSSEGHIPVSGYIPTEFGLHTLPSNQSENPSQETKTLPYQNPQDAIKGVTPNYGYISGPNEWENFGQAVRPEVDSNQTYGQAAQQRPWASHLPTNDLYSKRENELGYAHYPQNQLHQQESVPFARGTSRHDYQPDGISDFRQYGNTNSALSRNGDDNLQGMQTKFDYYAQGSGYIGQYDEPDIWGQET
eukprot:Gb_32150 [translate_table: standard]